MTSANNTVLYLSFDGLTDPLGQSQILPYLAGLSHYPITIVSFEKRERFESGRHSVEEICQQRGLRWVPLTYHNQPPVVSTVMLLWQLRQTARRLHERHPFAIVHCRSYLTALVGQWMKRRYGARFLFDMRGFWADERVEGGLWKLTNPVYRWIYSFFKRKEKEFVRDADAVVTLTENARDEIAGWNVKTTVHVIPCCVDLEHFDPAAIAERRHDELQKELGIRPGQWVLLYLGSLGTWYRVNAMLDFFTQVKKIRSDARFLVVTPDRLNLMGYSEAPAVVVRYASREDVPAYISLADASVMFIQPSFSKKASSATKMAEVLAMGVPVVTNTGWGDIDRWSIDGLFTVDSPTDYERVIRGLPDRRHAGMIRSEAARRFSLRQGVAVYEAIYRDLI